MGLIKFSVIQHLTKMMSALCRLLSIMEQIDGTQSVAVNYNLDLFYNPSHFMCPPLKCQSSFILCHCPALHMFWRYKIDISYMIIDQPPDVFIFSIFLPVDKIVLQCYATECDPKESGGQYWKSYYSSY